MDVDAGYGSADLATATVRLRVTSTEVMYVDVPADEASNYLVNHECHSCGWSTLGAVQDRYCPVCKTWLSRVLHGYLELCEAYDRWRTIIAGAGGHVEAALDAEITTDPLHHLDDPLPVDGTAPQQMLWTARAAVMDARHRLSQARYREGHCPDLDAVNRDLGAIEERLRVMAMDVDKQRQSDRDGGS